MGKTGEDVDKAVVEFKNWYVATYQGAAPERMLDRIDPFFPTLSPADEQKSYDQYQQILKKDGIETNLGMHEFLSCKTWRELADVTYDSQPI